MIDKIKDDYEGIAGYVRDADLNLGYGLPTEFASINEGYTNVKFRLGNIENLPVTANKAEVIISDVVTEEKPS